MLRVHMEAAPPVVMIHAGILLKIGAYGMLRFGVGLFPTLLKPMAFWLALFGLVNVLYGGILAFVQKELRGVLAYSSISHMGIILLGISAMNLEGFEGALLQSVSHGYISALLFFLVGSLYERTKTTVLEDLGGLGKTVPLLAGFLLTAGLALLGLPGLSGFISEFFALIGLFAVKPVVGTVATLGIILAAVYTLRAVMRITFGGLSERGESLADLRRSEWMAMLVLLVFIVAIGVYPNFVVQPTASPLQMMVSQIGG
jgi:NADH-quinone oxidoreductase subunit M